MVDICKYKDRSQKHIVEEKKVCFKNIHTVWTYSYKKNLHKIVTHIFVATYTHAGQNFKNALKGNTQS